MTVSLVSKDPSTDGTKYHAVGCRSDACPQWHRGCSYTKLEDGTGITDDLVREVLVDEMENTRAQVGHACDQGRVLEARELFEAVAHSDQLADFLTLPAYEAMVAVEGGS